MVETQYGRVEHKPTGAQAKPPCPKRCESAPKPAACSIRAAHRLHNSCSTQGPLCRQGAGAHAALPSRQTKYPGHRQRCACAIPAHQQHSSGIMRLQTAGPGEPGLSLAAELPGSTVTCTDYSSGMVQLAEQRAKDSGLHNTRSGRFSCNSSSCWMYGWLTWGPAMPGSRWPLGTT